MTIKKQYLLPLISLLFSYNCLALNLANAEQPPRNSFYDARSCHELYIQASALEQDTFIYKNDFYNDRGTQVAAYAMTIFTPAVYYFGYKAYKDYEANVRSANAQSEIDKIRLRMAEKRCFEKQ